FIKVFGEQAASNVNSIQGRINNLNSEVMLFNKAFDETVGISDKVGKVLKAVADMVIFFREHLRQTIAVIVATGSAILWAFSPTIVGGVLALAGWLKKATYAMMAFNVATMANPVGAMASAML